MSAKGPGIVIPPSGTKHSDELDEHLALNANGWHKASTTVYTNAKPKFGEIRDCYCDDTGEWKVHIDDWNPTENIEQAFMCLDAIDSWNRVERKGDIFVALLPHIREVSTNRAKAISLACAKATGWEE